MFKALVLDARINVVPHAIFGGLTLLSLILGLVVTELLVMTWVFPALWLSFASESHRDLARGGPIGRLQSVLGVSRRQAVLARYLTVALVSCVVLAGAALIWFVAPEAGGASAQVLVALTAAVTMIAAIGLTLGYVAPAPIGQIAVIVLAPGLALLGLGPVLVDTQESWSTGALADFLWSGPVPLVAIFGAAAVAALVAGCALAQRAHASATL